MLERDILQLLACPWDHSDLRVEGEGLLCSHGHSFSLEGDVPVLTDHVRREALPRNMKHIRSSAPDSPVDPFVNQWLVNTNGNLYWGARGRLSRYPIPNWPLARSEANLVVDIGCSWGRWCVAASCAGFRSVGVDVHIDALTAAVRVSEQLGAHAGFICAGANHLPLKPASVDTVFSYSVLQHLERAIVREFFREAARVLKPGGMCLVQLPNRFGPLALFRQAKRRFRDGKSGSLDMRYWSRTEIRKAVEDAGLRLVSIRADGFFTQNPQLADLKLLPLWGRVVVLVSHMGSRLATVFPILVRFADSLWIEARAPAASAGAPSSCPD